MWAALKFFRCGLLNFINMVVPKCGSGAVVSLQCQNKRTTLKHTVMKTAFRIFTSAFADQDKKQRRLPVGLIAVYAMGLTLLLLQLRSAL